MHPVIHDVTIALGIAFVATFGGAHLLWWLALRPARLYQGESAVRPDRRWEFLQAECYKREAIPWLWVVRILWVLGFLLFIALLFALVADGSAAA